MKVFISWSGARSHEVAKLLDEWINCVIQAVNPWVSSKNIDKGSMWFSEITKELADTHNGIICLTKENLNNPWILFEAGALAKGLASNRVFTFLVDMKPIDVKDPLAQFNHTMPNKEGLYRLVTTINNGLEENSLKPEILENVFNTWWPKFEKDFKAILKNTPEQEEVVERTEGDLLNEILYSVRGMDKRLRDVEDHRFENRGIEHPGNKSLTRILYLDKIKTLLADGKSESEIYSVFKEVLPKASMSKLITVAKNEIDVDTFLNQNGVKISNR